MSMKLKGGQVVEIPDEEEARYVAQDDRTALEQCYDNRRRAYRDEVADLKGVDMDESANIGFVLDAVIGQLAAAIAAGEITATDEMTALIARFGAVKSTYPKP